MYCSPSVTTYLSNASARQLDMVMQWPWIVRYSWSVNLLGANMPFVFSRVEYCDMHLCTNFVVAMQMLLSKNVEDVTPKGEFRLEVCLREFHRQCVRLAVFRVLLSSLKGRWFERLIHERTFFRWCREIHVCPLVEWPLAFVYHICRRGELYARTIYILTTIKGTTSWTRRPCSTYGIVPLGKSTSGTVKRNFIHRWGAFYPGRHK